MQTELQRLPGLIEETVALEQELERLASRTKNNREWIKAALLEYQIKRQPTAGGYEALLIEEERLAWNVEKLARALSKEQFEEFCPRKPESGKLRALLASGAHKDLRQCAKACCTARLELRAPARGQEVANV
jgi:hypothetical protein